MSTPEEQTQTYEQKINEVVNNLQQDEAGKWVFPDNLDESTKYAVTAERRRRDTQSAYTKTQQELARTKAENQHLAEGWQRDFASTLEPTVQAELEELKVTDPDAWRTKLNELEGARQAKFQETRTEIGKKAQHESELEYRTRALQEFADANPDFQLTDEIIQNDLPPRFVKQLENKEVTFSQFLENARNYLTKGKVVKPVEESVTDKINLSRATGSAEPSEDAVRQQLSTSYSDEIY